MPARLLDPRLTDLMRRLPRTPAGIAGTMLVTLMVVLAIIGPPIWGAEAERIDTAVILQGAVGRAPARHRQPGPRHPRPGAGRRPALADPRPAGHAHRRVGRGRPRRAALGAAAAAPRRAGHRHGQRAGRLPRAAAGHVHRGRLRGSAREGAVLGIGVAIAPGFARLTQTLAASVAGADYVSAARMLGVARRADHDAPRPAQHRRAADPQRSPRRWAARCSALRRDVLPRPGRAAAVVRLGPAARSTASTASTSPRPSPSAPAVAVALAGHRRSTCWETPWHTRRRAPPYRRARTPPRAVPTRRARIDEPEPDAVLEVRDLTVTFPGGADAGARRCRLRIAPGEIVGLVGESGSGKSLTALAIGGLVAHPGRVTRHGCDCAARTCGELPDSERRRLLGTSLAMVFQDPMTSLNPALTGRRAARRGGHRAPGREPHARRMTAGGGPARARADPGARAAGPAVPARVLRRHAAARDDRMGLMGTPRLIIADEPTTALDVTVQRQVLRLLREVSRRDRRRRRCSSPTTSPWSASSATGCGDVRGPDRRGPARRASWPPAPRTPTPAR